MHASLENDSLGSQMEVVGMIQIQNVLVKQSIQRSLGHVDFPCIYCKSGLHLYCASGPMSGNQLY